MCRVLACYYRIRFAGKITSIQHYLRRVILVSLCYRLKKGRSDETILLLFVDLFLYSKPFLEQDLFPSSGKGTGFDENSSSQSLDNLCPGKVNFDECHPVVFCR